jgi:hypothetical protein
VREADKNNQLAKLGTDLAKQNNELSTSLTKSATATEKSTKLAGHQTSYILVFTITTVFYLPIGFVTVSSTAL